MTVLAQPNRVFRHESEQDRWEMVHGAPDPRLRGHVLSYCSYHEQTTSFTRRRELPSDRVVLIVNLGEPIRVLPAGATGGWSDQPEGFFAGLHDSYAVTETGGSQAGVQVDLTPVGAHLLLGLPMDELSHRVVTLEELFGRGGTLFREALSEAPGWAERFEVVDEFLLTLLDHARSPVPSVTRALGRLRESGGTVPVGVIAAEIGCSRRHLISRFREQVGVTPKLLARILRFERVVSLVDARTEMGWAEIARACGYYDQAHMIRDFNQFAGGPPNEFARRRLPDGGGVIGD
ncbi:MAG: helix-turn-helix domain-containing protein [Thermoleophilaceae bacterium]